jgi:peptidoglycan/LPS O-acetylase OafA/YrhL
VSSVVTSPARAADPRRGHGSDASTAHRFGYKPALDGLRAVAVVSVMAYHFGAAWAPGGFLGVDMFFVLSGYLITSLLLVEWSGTRTLDLTAFWARRARRLLPALFLVLAAIALWAMLAARSDRLDTIRADSLWTLFYGANWHFIASGQSYFDLFSEASPLRHAWSLAIEEQFYLVWPLVTFACLRLARGRHWLLATVCVGGTAASALVMTRLYDPADPSRAFYGTDTRAGQLLLGALLAIVLVNWSPATTGARRAVLGAGALGAGFCLWAIVVVHDTSSWLYHGGYVLFAIATAAMIMLVVSPQRSFLQAALVPRPIRWIGAISYGLYLWHWPVAIALSAPRTGLSGLGLAALRVAVTFGAATLSYYLVEVPIRRGRWLNGPVARVAAPVAGVTTAVLIVLATAGATAPPSFLVANSDRVVRSAPAPAPAPPATEPVAPRLPTESELGVSRILLLGDSVADSIHGALQQIATERGVTLVSLTRPGCGMTSAVPLWQDGRPREWGPACAEGTAEYQSGAVDQENPDTVVWISTWETSDQIYAGTRADFGTAEGDAALLGEFEAAWARLTAGGARLVLVTVPPPALDGEVQPLPPTEGQRRMHLNVLMHEFAQRHPENVAVADLAWIVCPLGDPCSGTIDGVKVRPRDGNHYEGDGPAWVGPRLYAAIIGAVAGISSAP